MIRLPSVLLLSLAVAAQTPTQSRIVYDDQGAAYVLSAPPRRIISLAPNITEILFALGLEKEVVGVTRYCDYPLEALQKKKIGGMIDPSLEMITSLNPDLIIAYRLNPLATIERLRNLRFRIFVFDTGNSLDSIITMILKIGQITDRKSSAAALGSELRARFDGIKKKLSAASATPRTFLVLQGTGLWTCGRGSYLHDLLVKAGARNVAEKVQRAWFHYSPEQLIQDDPEVIIIQARSAQEFHEVEGRFLSDPRFRGIKAVRTQRISWLDENRASRFGPRLAQALEETARIIHPECFRDGP